MKNFNKTYKAAAALGCCLLAAPLLAGAVGALDTTKACSLSMQACGDEELANLSATAVQAKLYRVADVDAIYQYTAVAEFAGLATINDNGTSLPLKNLKDDTAAQWELAAAQAAALAEGVTPTREVAFAAGTASVTGLTPGLYLLCTDTANTGEYVYTYAPILISLPSMDAADGSDIYDITGVKLKPARTDAKADLAIGKTLSRYSTLQGPATFVFSVEAVRGGKTVYSNVVSMVFDAAGSKTVTLKDLPVGAEVTVTEVYSGACYQATTQASQTVTIKAKADGENAVRFANDYDDSRRGGTSVTNRFDPGAGSWQWKQVTDNTAA